jgi:hypothetical protein
VNSAPIAVPSVTGKKAKPSSARIDAMPQDHPSQRVVPKRHADREDRYDEKDDIRDGQCPVCRQVLPEVVLDDGDVIDDDELQHDQHAYEGYEARSDLALRALVLGRFLPDRIEQLVPVPIRRHHHQMGGAQSARGDEEKGGEQKLEHLPGISPRTSQNVDALLGVDEEERCRDQDQYDRPDLQQQRARGLEHDLENGDKDLQNLHPMPPASGATRASARERHAFISATSSAPLSRGCP